MLAYLESTCKPLAWLAFSVLLGKETVLRENVRRVISPQVHGQALCAYIRLMPRMAAEARYMGSYIIYVIYIYMYRLMQV